MRQLCKPSWPFDKEPSRHLFGSGMPNEMAFRSLGRPARRVALKTSSFARLHVYGDRGASYCDALKTPSDTQSLICLKFGTTLNQKGNTSLEARRAALNQSVARNLYSKRARTCRNGDLNLCPNKASICHRNDLKGTPLQRTGFKHGSAPLNHRNRMWAQSSSNLTCDDPQVLTASKPDAGTPGSYFPTSWGVQQHPPTTPKQGRLGAHAPLLEIPWGV